MAGRRKHNKTLNVTDEVHQRVHSLETYPDESADEILRRLLGMPSTKEKRGV